MRIIIKKVSGGVDIMSLVNPAYESSAIDKWKLQYPGEYVSHRSMPDNAIPVDRKFRNAWDDTTPPLVIDIDMVKARDIHRDHLRKLRQPKLNTLDYDYMKADEVGNPAQKNAIIVKKEALRDVTIHPSIEAATTIAELEIAGIAVINAN